MTAAAAAANNGVVCENDGRIAAVSAYTAFDITAATAAHNNDNEEDG